MSNTTTTYLSIANNQARYQTLTQQQPAVKTATAYYQANIGQGEERRPVRRQLPPAVLCACRPMGLGDQINNTALVKQVLSQGTANPKALANILPNANWKAFAKAFNFSAEAPPCPIRRVRRDDAERLRSSSNWRPTRARAIPASSWRSISSASRRR